MHPEIENLIDLALADGQITEKERNVILKKAAELGFDTDEVEVILEAKIHQLKPKKKRIEDLNTCPSCGEIISGLSRTCICGYVINSNDIKNSKSLEEAIETLENLIVKIRASGKNSSKSQLESFISQIEKEVRYIKTRYGNDSNVSKLLKELEELSDIQIRKVVGQKKRKTISFRLLLFLLIILTGFLIYKIMSNETPKESFNRKVIEKYQNSINIYKVTDAFQKDSVHFFKLYNYILKNQMVNKKEYDSLQSEFNKIQLVNPSPYRFYYLARQANKNGDVNNSIKYIDSCLVLYPNFAPIYFYKSTIENISFNIRKDNLSKAIELDKNKNRYLYARSLLFYKDKEYEKSYYDIRKFNELNENNYQSNLWEIAVLFDLNMEFDACAKLANLKNRFSKQYAFTKNQSETAYNLIEKKCSEL